MNTSRETRRWSNKFLVALAAVELAALATLGWSNAAFPTPGIPLFFVAFAAYGFALRHSALERGALRPWLLWSTAILTRLVFLPLAPRLSDDVYRYLWDGHVQMMGVNPYLFAPSSAALEPYRTAWHHLINNPDVPTIYPPAAQGVFALLALLGGSLLTLKLAWIGCDLAAGWLLGHVASASGRDPRFVQAAYLWSPLLIVESAWSGHLEALGLLSLTLLLLAAWHSQARLSGAALGLSALVKLAPLAALPPLARRFGAWAALTTLVVFCAGYVPYARAGPALWSGLSTYAEHWRFNEGVFWLIERLTPGALSPRAVAAATVIGVVAWTTTRRFDVERALLWIMGAGILLSPTVHPWYVLWVLPMAALRPNRAWLLMTGMAFLCYWGLDSFKDGGGWIQPLPVRLLIWGPFLCLLVWDFARNPQLDKPPDA